MTVAVVVIAVLSAADFFLFGVDKRRAVKHRWRIPEATLLLLSIPGGIGGLLGMHIFHHKTRKWKFRILVPLFAVIDVLFLAVFLLT